MIELLQEIWQTMRTNKLRTFLTGFSVSWGIFMLITLLALAKGTTDMSMQFTMSSDPNRLTIYGGRSSMPYQGLQAGRWINLNSRDIKPLEESDVRRIKSVTGMMSLSGQISTQLDYVSSNAVGVYPEKINSQFTFLYGRGINQADISEMRKVIMLSEKDAKILFRDLSKAVGQTVRLGDFAFTVIGIYKHEWENSPYVPFSTAVALSGYNANNLWQMEVYTQNINDTEESSALVDNVRKKMGQLEKFDPNDQGAVYIIDRLANAESQKKANNYLTYAMWVIGILTLLTGIVGVSNIMFVSVRERTHEIGVRRAIGAKPYNILAQVILESVVLTTVFGYVGIVLGTAATELAKRLPSLQEIELVPKMDLSIAIEVTSALIIAGALAGIFPALRALKIKPVEALQEE